ncbi:MAG: chromosome segregation protein SMC [Acutalibacteraceae bacterium]
MLLKSLELQGFKTFPDKTKLTFDKGITSVVGPNGSGKSNISDAIRWVLGEQSPKSLRCSKMEDVVFNGTDKRKRQGFAEVTLTIENKDRFLPFDGDEVAVTRRFYRSGESEYQINKAAVRLKDIHELFMDTGLGRDGYSMIGQGKIDSIVSSKSEDRREIFEEAAGISRYRYRKTEAERKLARSEENLVRLRDIVAELESRVGPLRIQAQKAEAFLEYSKEKQGLEIALWLDTLDKSSAVLKQQEDKIAIAKSQHEEAENTLQKIADETEQIFLKNGELSAEIDELHRAISSYEEEISYKRSSISVAQNDILHNKENLIRLQNEIAEAETSKQDLQEQIAEKEEKIKYHNSVIADKQSEYNDVSEKLNNINITSGRSGDLLQEVTARLSALTAQAADYKVAQMTGESSISELTLRKSSLKESKASKQQQLAQLIQMESEYKDSVSDTQNKISSLTNSISGLKIKLASRQKKRDELKAQSDKLNLDTQEKLRRAKLLEDLERNLEGFSNSVKTVMNMSKNGLLGGIHGPVSRVIDVPKQYTVAIEIALGAAMQNIVTSTQEDAKRAITMLKQKDSGRATFLPISTIKGRELNESGLDDCYGFIGIAADLCCCDEQYNGILYSLLGRIVIADDLNCAVAIANKYSYRFKVVTLDGQVVNAGGSLTGGSLGKKSGLLTRTAEIAEIRKQAQLLTEQSERVTAELKKSEEEYSFLEGTILASQGDLSLENSNLARIEAEHRACLNEINSVKNQIAEIDGEYTACENKIAGFLQTKNEASERLIEISSKIAEAESEIDSISGDRAVLSEKREQLSEQLQNLRLEIVTYEKDIDALRSEIDGAKALGENQQLRKETAQSEIDRINKRSVETTKLISDLENETNAISAKIDKCKEKINEINERKTQLEKLTVQLRHQERDKTFERENIGRELARLEERKISLQKQYDDIIAKLWEEYELTRREAEEISIKIDDIKTAQKRLNELKQKIKSLGSVNVSAIEEYKEVSERYEFLSAQVKDVEKSKNEIERLITDLTKQMKEVFVESFSQINTNFTATFKELFGGGTASLSLSDPENILTSGIDIIVHPPGKIVVHLEALSGGEKALVAIALYFAIMKVRPAPFCVMDEIEAALDDVNVERFAQYMRRMTSKTQFITITHRRGTMEEADVLYGVTMQDEGISKMLELRASEVAAKLGIKSN